MNPRSEPGHASPRLRFTQKQGQYLALIHAYTLVLGRPPAEADLRRHFRVTPPSVHQMLITLERTGLIRRQPGVARSIQLLIDPSTLPPLRVAAGIRRAPAAGRRHQPGRSTDAAEGGRVCESLLRYRKAGCIDLPRAVDDH
ncbi:MAG TPA: hypothetical protein VHY82_16780 [Acetobacteraceae bacterium]|nr:hypothetical protein [Acetobacteraceae bacterium]